MRRSHLSDDMCVGKIDSQRPLIALNEEERIRGKKSGIY